MRSNLTNIYKKDNEKMSMLLERIYAILKCPSSSYKCRVFVNFVYVDKKKKMFIYVDPGIL